jgi:hypothetical protein
MIGGPNSFVSSLIPRLWGILPRRVSKVSGAAIKSLRVRDSFSSAIYFLHVVCVRVDCVITSTFDAILNSVAQAWIVFGNCRAVASISFSPAEEIRLDLPMRHAQKLVVKLGGRVIQPPSITCH